MSENSGQKDPSMEEILGSIRRIISEDSAQVGTSAAGEAEVDEDEDVLELTDEVAEEVEPESRREPIFGARGTGAGGSVPAHEPGARREPILGPGRFQAAQDVDEGLAGSAEQTEADEYDAGAEDWSETAGQDEAAWSEPADAPEPIGEEATGQDEIWADAYEPAGEQGAAEPEAGGGEWPEQQEDQPMTMQSDEPAEGDATGTSEPETGEIMSETASLATSAALSELNRAMSEKGSRMKVGEGEITIAEMVRDLLRPMLREWLDENLPAIVERVVKREIQKLVDRTQDDD